MIVNIISIAVIVLGVFFAVRGSVKHFRHEGGCCGGGSSTVVIEKKLEGKVLFTKKAKIEGMKCINCQNNVQNHLNEIEGLSARVSYKKGSAILKMTRDVDNQEIIDKVNSAGNGDYKVIKIE